MSKSFLQIALNSLVASFLLCSLIGCTSVSEPVRTGKNSYLLTVKGCDGALLFGASCSTEGIKMANKFCERKGLVATVAHFDVSQNFGVPEHGQVQFVCTDEEHQQDAVLRPDKGIETIQQR
jgi:hypothetical protein